MSVVVRSRLGAGEGEVPEYPVLVLAAQQRPAVLAARVVAVVPALVWAEFVLGGGGGGGRGQQGVLAEDEDYHGGQDEDYCH